MAAIHTESSEAKVVEKLNKYETTEDVFEALAARAIDNGFIKGMHGQEGYHFKIATMCSGTDAPVIACREIRDAFASLGYMSAFSYTHVFSVEIEAYKQAFIRRNSPPEGHIFRDVEEIADKQTA